MKTRIILGLLFSFLFSGYSLDAQTHSIAREWNEILLESIRKDFARPTVHARNLFHVSAAMYDVWAVYDGEAEPLCMGKTFGGYDFVLEDFTSNKSKEESIEEAISYAVYTLLNYRFQDAPKYNELIVLYDQKMAEMGYDINKTDVNYTSGDPASFGNYVAWELIKFGANDGSNESSAYANQFYKPVNPPLIIKEEGNPDITDKNRWQPLAFSVFIDQSGNQIPGNIPNFLSPEWGIVKPFSLTPDDLRIERRDNFDYYIYHDPGPPAYLSNDPAMGWDDNYKWGHALVAVWSSHLSSEDTTTIDISPGTVGNIQSFPADLDGLKDFYDLENGGDNAPGYTINPVTNMPYEKQIVKRGDYARVLAEFWADGPDSETPPGHWFTILNYVSDQPELEKKFGGQGEVMSDLEWDIKAYLLLGGAMHDVAVTVWGLKGYYDYIRPVSAIRAMAEAGQSSDESLPSYHPEGLPLLPGFIELIEAGDPLQGSVGEFINEVKVRAWRGPEFINDPDTDDAGVGWIRAKNWWPYQRPTFVTPPFAGYVSGHSTFSRAAAEILTALTGSPYFPRGMGEFVAPKNEFLVFEEGPSEDIILQWAKYYDASDQCSLSRIWGGIHPPCDDIPGRRIGIEIGHEAFDYGRRLFYADKDNDGFLSYEDCDDNDATIYPGASELCNGLDDDCNGLTDDNLPLFTYFLDADQDGFGDVMTSIDTCIASPPAGYVTNASDCRDDDDTIHPNTAEVCDGIDNDCNDLIDDGLTTYTYFLDADDDGFGDANRPLDTCLLLAPNGFVENALDCNDADPDIHPNAAEVCDGIDNDCNQAIDDGLTVYTYYADQDNDGFGDIAVSMDTCLLLPPSGFVGNAADCNDADETIHPNALEVCDDIDNNCNGLINEGLARYVYFLDSDNDGFGDPGISVDTCLATPIPTYVTDNTDCDDTNPAIYPGAQEIADNGIDEDCSGIDLFQQKKVFPSVASDQLNVHFVPMDRKISIQIFNSMGQRVYRRVMDFDENYEIVDVAALPSGIYLLYLIDEDGDKLLTKDQFIKVN